MRLLMRAFSTPLTLPEIVIYTAAMITIVFCTLVLALSHMERPAHPATATEREAFARTHKIDLLCEWGDKYDPTCPP
jgi:hypothetical protein